MRNAQTNARRALFLLVAMIIGSMIFAEVGPSGAKAQDTASAEQQLAEKYAPIAMLRAQESNCDKDGEGYFPAPVDFLFDNPDITLKVAGDGDAKDDVVLKQGITPQDLVTAGPNAYLDYPGDPRDPGCEYEQYFKQKVADEGLEPTTYAKIIVDEATGRLYLEYWFYYYFNDWNDTHEADWEMMLAVFNATSAEEALQRDPIELGYAQHGGGELGNWGDEKIQLDGTRPLVFPSAGSHATYYGQHTFVGWGENGTAFGCDNTTAPSVETPLNVVLIPDVIDPNGPFAWAAYEGRWGQREIAVFNGPYGPNHGSKWNDPTESISTWRTSTLKIPSSKAAGINATDLFCSLSEWGSKATIYLGSHPWATGAIVLAILGLFGFAIYKTWAYFMEALDIYGNEIRTFLGIGMLAVPIGLGFNALAILAGEVPPGEWFMKLFNESSGGRLTAAAIVGGAQQAVMALFVVPAVVYAMKDIRQGIKPGVWRSYRGSLHYFPQMLVALLIFILALVGAAFSILLVPVAIYVAVRWQFYPQAIILDEAKPGWNGLGESWAVTKRQWFKAFGYTIGFLVLATVPGPLIGVLILILGGSRVQFANFVSSFLYALLIPLAYIGLTMVYHRLKREEIVEPQMRTQELHPEKGRTTPPPTFDKVGSTGD